MSESVSPRGISAGNPMLIVLKWPRLYWAAVNDDTGPHVGSPHFGSSNLGKFPKHLGSRPYRLGSSCNGVWTTATRNDCIVNPPVPMAARARLQACLLLTAIVILRTSPRHARSSAQQVPNISGDAGDGPVCWSPWRSTFDSWGGPIGRWPPSWPIDDDNVTGSAGKSFGMAFMGKWMPRMSGLQPPAPHGQRLQAHPSYWLVAGPWKAGCGSLLLQAPLFADG